MKESIVLKYLHHHFVKNEVTNVRMHGVIKEILLRGFIDYYGFKLIDQYIPSMASEFADYLRLSREDMLVFLEDNRLSLEQVDLLAIQSA